MRTTTIPSIFAMAIIMLAFSACDKEQLPAGRTGKTSALVMTEWVTWRADITGRLTYKHDEKLMYLGVTYSPQTSVTILVGGKFHGILAGYSYECYTSAINPANGSHELYLGYQIDVNLVDASLAGADVMVGDVVISESTASVNLVRQICVFRLTVTCSTTAWYDDYYERVSTVKISVDNAGTPAVIATAGALAVTEDTYTGSFAATAYGTIKYTLNDFYSSDLNTSGGPKTQVFYAPIFSDGDLEEGYTLRFHYGGRSREGWGASWESVETFGGGCVQNKTVTEKKTLEKGKIYGFTMTI